MSFIRIRDENFFDIEESPLWIFQEISTFQISLKIERGTLLSQENFLSLILMKFKKIFRPLGHHILNFIKIRDKKIFDIEGSPLWIFQKI